MPSVTYFVQVGSYSSFPFLSIIPPYYDFIKGLTRSLAQSLHDLVVCGNAIPNTLSSEISGLPGVLIQSSLTIKIIILFM